MAIFPVIDPVVVCSLLVGASVSVGHKNGQRKYQQQQPKVPDQPCREHCAHCPVQPLCCCERAETLTPARPQLLPFGGAFLGFLSASGHVCIVAQQWVLSTWVAVGISASCVFFNQGVFYHPPGVFYTMGCYKMPKIISKIKSYATRPPMKYFFQNHHPPSTQSRLTLSGSASVPPVLQPVIAQVCRPYTQLPATSRQPLF